MLTARQLEALELMRDKDEELVCDGPLCWVDTDQFGWQTERALLRHVAIKDVSDVKGCRRYVINDVGLGVLERPTLADEVVVALLRREPFSVRDGHIVGVPTS